MSLKTEVSVCNGFAVLKLAEDNELSGIDNDMLHFIKRCNLAGKNVIDGGSNIGVFSLCFSTLIADGLVYAFELQRLIYQIGCANFIFNGVSNIIAFNLALSDKSGEWVGFTHIDYSGKNISSTGIRTEPELGKTDYYDRTKTIALDDLNIQNIGLIKLDIEGHEEKALDGMWQSIDRWNPFLLIELSPGYLEGKVDSVIDKIKSHGYSVTEISNYNYCCEPI